MDVCCVRGCTSVNQNKDIVYFEFPLSRTLRRKWLDVIKIGSKVPLGTLICSQHFPPQDYETVRGRVRLKKKVVPSILYNNEPVETATIANTDEKQTNASESVETEVCELPKDVHTTIEEKDVNESDLNVNDGDREQKRSNTPKSDFDSDTRKILAHKELQGKEDKDNCAILDERNRVEYKKELKTDREEADVSNVQSKECCSDSLVSAERVSSDPKQPPDFEEMITNYHIKIDKRNALRCDEMEVEVPPMCEGDSTIVVDDTGDKPPVFIEISADKDANSKTGASQDCLMVLESVQVELDPSTLMLPERDSEQPNEDSDSDVEINIPDQKPDPISLLTSSDEDDVIIQEPKIDTVEISDEDEDDMPLVKLVKKKPLKKRSIRQPNKLGPMNAQDLRNIIWSGDYGFYCVHCNFSTTDSLVYASHLEEHERALHICEICSYTTASKKQYSKHLRKHKEEKKYKCHLCDYRARHNMSLIYHLQSHTKSKSDEQCVKKGFKSVKKGFKCVKCGFRSDYKGDVVKHLKLCDNAKKYSCNLCTYSSKRKSDLKRHWSSRHNDVVEVDSDDSYKPSGLD